MAGFRRLAIAALVVVFLAAAVIGADRFTERRAVTVEIDRLTAIAKLAASSYERQVDKFQLVATTLSADPDVVDLLDRRAGDSATRLNARLAGLTAALDASVIYLIDDSGTTIASSNSRQADSFVGLNYGFRPYFRQAMAQGRFEQYALGTRSRIPGLFVARRVTTAGGTRGVIVVKIRFDRLENEWAGTLGTAFVASEQGVILVTSKPEWRFQTIGKLDAGARKRLTAQVEYGDAPLRQGDLFAGGNIIRSGSQYRRGAQFVAATDRLPNGWTVQVLQPLGNAVADARAFGRLVVALTFAMVAGIVIAFLFRARSIVAQAARENEARTAELKDRLVQANKLSSLGQIAAGVGHEINQPLTAIGIRAKNGRKLIDKGRFDEAASVFDELGALVARAGAITGELRRFARRTRHEVGKVALSDVFDGVRLLLGDRLRSAGTVLTVAGPDVVVIGDQGRLEQVLVNLVQNALDAMGSGGAIDVLVSAAEDVATIRLGDTGPGISEAVRERLFQPFSSSKTDGLGLGLVICRDIMIDLGGDLSLAPGPGGATFVMTLKVAP
ncbi:ATP-binding protein [Sphingomonas sp. SUN039]|uniref:ATP-binding protein n=1 Tax=Sphingomonas sp. SUN039 TaxID=2937787 RepID=UPI002164DC9C|nr:ATP-binding protein [Sphingomonas sp. SUN039]UVO53116.1 ATP-binding protein [Sphingomonas sp. SUN039]